MERMEGEEIVSFLSSDGIRFEVSKTVAAMILGIKPCELSISIDGGDDYFVGVAETADEGEHEDEVKKESVRVLEVRSSILFKVIEYCNHRAMEGVGDEEKCEEDDWDQQFIDGFDNKTVISLGMAAEILKISELQKLAGRKVTKLFPVLHRWGIISDRDVFDYELVNSAFKSDIFKKLAEVEMRDRALRAMSYIPLKEPDSFQDRCDVRRSPLGPDNSHLGSSGLVNNELK